MESDHARRFIVPAAVVLVVVVLVWLTLDFARFVVSVLDGEDWRFVAWSPFGVLPAVMLGAVVGVAMLWGRAGRALLMAALGVTGIGLGLQFVAMAGSIAGIVGPPSGSDLRLIAFHLVDVIASVVVLIWFVQVDRSRVRVRQPAPAPALPAEPSGPAPAWQPDQAAGAHWSTASGAATGAAANQWGTPGERGGWNAPAIGSGAPEIQPEPENSIPQRLAPGPAQPPHQPREPRSFGPQAVAERYGRPAAESDPDQTQLAPRRTPPQWTPLDRNDPNAERPN